MKWTVTELVHYTWGVEAKTEEEAIAIVEDDPNREMNAYVEGQGMIAELEGQKCDTKQMRYTVYGGAEPGDKHMAMETFTDPAMARALAAGLLLTLGTKRYTCYWVAARTPFGVENVLCAYRDQSEIEAGDAG